jgi:hypothetical protein
MNDAILNSQLNLNKQGNYVVVLCHKQKLEDLEDFESWKRFVHTGHTEVYGGLIMPEYQHCFDVVDKKFCIQELGGYLKPTKEGSSFVFKKVWVEGDYVYAEITLLDNDGKDYIATHLEGLPGMAFKKRTINISDNTHTRHIRRLITFDICL